jgi:hypothetical protein
VDPRRSANALRILVDGVIFSVIAAAAARGEGTPEQRWQ